MAPKATAAAATTGRISIWSGGGTTLLAATEGAAGVAGTEEVAVAAAGAALSVIIPSKNGKNTE
tara:strand:- start:113 stop:304 length:192 start_codon:yes stop_codon:yes gene_type:complete